MNSYCAIEAQEYAVINANVARVNPSTVKAVLIRLILLQLSEDFLLQGQLFVAEVTITANEAIRVEVGLLRLGLISR